MELDGRHVVVTGAAGGIGSALARRFAADGATVTVADLDMAGAERVAAEIDGTPFAVDAADPASIEALVASAAEANGPIDLFWSNAGIPGPMGGPVEATDHEWQVCWEINLMSQVWAARALLPQMLARGEGYLVSTASAAGLTTQVSAAAYSVTKHAAVALAEWLAITYRERGIRVSCMCPQGVQTAMLESARAEPIGGALLEAGGIMDPDEVAEVAVEAIRDERFLILPHPEVAKHMAFKGAEPERWLEGMRRAVASVRPDQPS
jgi:NAD(P)-dependent dehydrogenase (short-subunit alcohol dehydrogenase family)